MILSKLSMMFIPEATIQEVKDSLTKVVKNDDAATEINPTTLRGFTLKSTVHYLNFCEV